MAENIRFSGELTILTGDDARRRLLQALERADTVEIDCSEAESIDLSFLQIFLAAAKTARRDGRQLSLAHPVDGVLLAALGRAGLLSVAGTGEFALTE